MRTAAHSLLPSLLGQVRRRALLARAVRFGSAGALYGVTALAIAVLLAGRRLPPPAVLLTLLCLVAIPTLLLALRGIPSLLQVARLVDRKRRLAERLETALELAGECDEVARLLQRDAVEHLRTIDPRQVVPLRAGGNPKLAGLALALVALATLAIERLPVGGGRDGSRRAGSTAPSRGAQNPAGEARRPADRPPGEWPGAGAQRSPSSLSAGSASPPAAGLSTRTQSVVRKPGAGEGEVALSAADLSSSAGGGAPGRQPRSPTAAGAEKSSSDPVLPGVAPVEPVPATGRAARRRGAAGAAGSSGGGGAAGGQAGAAGDPVAGRPALSAGLPRFAGEPPDSWSQSRRADWLAVEHALAAEQLPPGLERYVRAYLLAVQAE